MFLLNKNNIVSDITPRKKEGVELFIKYIFDVKSINNISFEQAEKILEIKNWDKPYEIIKNIFKGMPEGIVYDEFIKKNYPESISFYTTKNLNNLNLKKNYNDFAPLKK